MYAFSPQEYITQIGQHLLTLRKQTEKYDQMEHDKRPLELALRSLSTLEFIEFGVKSCKKVTEIVLKCIARLCIRSFLGRTSNSVMSRLTENGRRQLSTDALYLDNVLEDLGALNTNEANVMKFKALLIE